MLDLHCIQTLSHEELQWESMESAVGAQCLSSLAEQKSCQLAYVLFLLPYFLSPAAFQGIRMWLLGIEENGLWAAALVCILELVMELPELCLYNHHSRLQLLGRHVCGVAQVVCKCCVSSARFP